MPGRSPYIDDLAKKNRAAKSGGFMGTAATFGGGASSYSNPKDPPVYLGGPISDYFPNLGPGPWSQQSIDKTQDKIATVSEVANQYYNWDSKMKNKFITQVALAGYNIGNMNDSDFQKLWESYAGQAAGYYNFGKGKKLTPWDILAKDRQLREAAKPRTVTQTQTSVDLSNRQDAHAIFLQAAQQLLGRDPTKSEIKNFQSSLNAYERANPTVSTTTSKYLGSELQSQSTQTSGGVKEGARGILATEDVKKDPEFGAYQAATTYMDALMEEIGGR